MKHTLTASYTNTPKIPDYFTDFETRFLPNGRWEPGMNIGRRKKQEAPKKPVINIPRSKIN